MVMVAAAVVMEKRDRGECPLREQSATRVMTVLIMETVLILMTVTATTTSTTTTTTTITAAAVPVDEEG